MRNLDCKSLKGNRYLTAIIDEFRILREINGLNPRKMVAHLNEKAGKNGSKTLQAVSLKFI